MADIRLHVVMNPGGEGIPLHKLADIAKEFEQFLGCLADDCHLPDRDKWLAINFSNGSFKSDLVHRGRHTEEQAILYNSNLSAIFHGKANPSRHGHISHKTFSHFANLSMHMDVGEHIGIGIYSADATVPIEIVSITQQHLSSMRNMLDDETYTFGAIQGTIHSIVRDKTKPYVEVKDVSTKLLVKCFYSKRHYKTIVEALEPADAMLNISGDLTMSRSSERIKFMDIAEIEQAPAPKTDILDRFFGCIPRVTGKSSSEAAVAKVRHG